MYMSCSVIKTIYSSSDDRVISQQMAKFSNETRQGLYLAVFSKGRSVTEIQ